MPGSRAQTSTESSVIPADWGVLSLLSGQKFVWNAGRARGSHEKELTFHEFRWNGQALLQAHCSYWPQKSMRPACGTHVIERLADGSFVLRSNGDTPVFKGTVAADGSIEFVNKTWFGTFTTTFVSRPDGSVALTHGNWVDGSSLAPLIPVDAAGESRIMADLESVFRSIQAERQADADRQYNALMGALGAFNTVLSAELDANRVRAARSRADVEAAVPHQSLPTRREARNVNDLPARPNGDTRSQVPSHRPIAAAPAQPPTAISSDISVRQPLAQPSVTAEGTAANPVAATASNRSRADGCVAPPTVSSSKCGNRSGLIGRVINSCTDPVDVRMCFATDAGWKCEARYGLKPEQAWEPGNCAANGPVFRSVRYSDSKEPLAQP
jgi:hypothetical protein